MHVIAYRLLLLVGYHYDTTHEAGDETDSYIANICS